MAWLADNIMSIVLLLALAVPEKRKEHTMYALEIMLCCFSEAARSFRRGLVLRNKTR